MIALVAEAKMVANVLMRGKGSASSTDFKKPFDELLTITPSDRIGLILTDGGFYNEAIMSRLKREKLRFIKATRMIGPSVRRIFEHKQRFPIAHNQ